MNFNYDTGTASSISTLDTTTASPLVTQTNVLNVVGNGAIALPSGTTAQRPSPATAGMFRWNSSNTDLEYYDGTNWDNLINGSSLGSYISVASANGLAGSVSGTTSATITLSTTITGVLVGNGTAISAATSATSFPGYAAGIAGGTAGEVPYQTAANTTGFSAAGTAGQVLVSGGTGAPTWSSAPSISGANITATTIPNSALDNSSVTIGTTTVALGGTSTSLAGMTGIAFASGTVTGIANPVNGQDAVNLQYLQSIVGGLEWKQEAQAATTGNLNATYANGAGTLTNAGTQAAFATDGYTANLGDRILVKNQTTQAQNGIYSVTTVGSGSSNWVLTRTTDANASAELNNATLFVTNGTTLANTAWTQTTANPTLGTSNIIFVQNSGSGTYTAGTGLTLSGNSFSLSTPVAVANGGTGTTTAPTADGVIYASSTTALASTAAGSTGQVLVGNTGAAPSFSTLSSIAVTTFAGGTTGLTPASATSGAVTLGGTLVVANGGTGATSFTSDGILYGNGTSAIQATAAGTQYQVLTAGAGGVPAFGAVALNQANAISGNLPLGNGGTNASLTAVAGGIVYSTGAAMAISTAGTSGYFLTSGGAGAPSWTNPATSLVQSFQTSLSGLTPSTATNGAVTLAGTLGISSGGTGQTSKSAAFNALSPIATTGDLIVGNGTNSATNLAIGTTGQILSVAGGTAAWASVSSLAVTSFSGGTTGLTPSSATQGAITLAGTLAVANGGTGLATTPANGQIDIGNGAGFTRTTLTAGTNIYITNGSGSITIAGPKYYAESSTAPGTAPSATGNQSVAIGSAAVASQYGGFVHASGDFSAAGDAQVGKYVLRNTTTNATQTELFMDGSAADYVVPASTMVAFSVMVAGVNTATNGQGGGWRIEGVIYRGATVGTTAFIGTPSVVILGRTPNGLNVTVAANASTGALQVLVTGVAATTFHWVANLEVTEAGIA